MSVHVCMKAMWDRERARSGDMRGSYILWPIGQKRERGRERERERGEREKEKKRELKKTERGHQKESLIDTGNSGKAAEREREIGLQRGKYNLERARNKRKQVHNFRFFRTSNFLSGKKIVQQRVGRTGMGRKKKFFSLFLSLHDYCMFYWAEKESKRKIRRAHAI